MEDLKQQIQEMLESKEIVVDIPDHLIDDDVRKEFFDRVRTAFYKARPKLFRRKATLELTEEETEFYQMLDAIDEMIYEEGDC